MRNLQAVSKLVKDGPFSEFQLRAYIQNAPRNGLAKHKAIVRVGRRVFIDVDAFERWLDSHSVKPEVTA
jgi:hypothetical protein